MQNKPDNHYKNCVIEPIEVIEKLLTPEEFRGFLLGSVLKYRLRAGHKTEGDIEKAMQYEEWIKQLNDNRHRNAAFEASDLSAAPEKETKDWIDLVKEFNETFNIKAPVLLDDKSIDLQFNLVEEEFNELVAAEHNEEALDAIGDLIYVLIGLALKLDFDLDAAFREIHRSNMSKLGVDGKPIFNEEGKVMKGPNFTLPYLIPYI